MAKRVLVVGAGPGGMATAMRLAAQGHRVTIYEAEDRVGGRMRGLSDGPYHFDSGPTILQVPRVYEQLFAECGLRFEDYVRLIRLDPNTRLRFWDDTHLDLTSRIPAFKEQLARFGPALPDAFDRWYVEHLAKNASGYGPYLGTPVRSPLGYLRPREIAAALPFRPWESLYAHFRRFFSDERLVYGLGYQAKYLGMHPKACSSVFSLVTFLEFHEGIWHPEGGFRALARGLARAAQDLGVTINLGRPVRQVLVENGRAVGLLMEDGETPRADAVVLNADFGYGVRNLLPAGARGRYSDRKLARMRFSCSTFMLYLGVDRRYDDLPHHQLYLADSIRNSTDPGPAGAFLEEQDPSFYVCNPTPVDPGNAPEGHSTLFVLVPIPNTLGGVDWAAKRQAYRDLIVGRMHKLGFEGVERHIVSERSYAAEDWRDEHRAHLGAVFNLVHSWRQLGPLRPHIRADGVRGMYWIGGAVHPGSGLMTIMEAARSAAHFIQQDLQIGR